MTRLTLRIDFGGDRQLGPGKVRLLELIGEHGSISAAGRLMTMSYKRAWTLIESLNLMFAEPVVVARAGGAGGGRAELTPKGREIVRAYRAIEASAAAAGGSEIQAIARHLANPAGG